MFRTHTCNDLTAKNENEKTTLAGWVFRRRDHGGLIFIDLRDRYGLTQIVFDPAISKNAHKIAEDVRPEWVIQVTGTVKKRLDGAANKDLPTGDIEVFIDEVEVLSKAKTPPFEIDSDEEVREDLRLEYRYLDLRKPQLLKNLTLRHKMGKVIRDFFDKEGFLEIETPALVKGTPEGSREYLVPSRLHHGEFYVLPQSPQQLKQLLMAGGIDKYFQIAKCFRDEDLRGDRQPEFTQYEIEMSFCEQEDVIEVIEQSFHVLTEKCAPQKEWKKHLVNGKFRRLTWQEAMETYGSDKPDLRFGMEMVDVTKVFENSEFAVFANAIKKGGVVKCLKAEGGSELSRKEIDDLTELAKTHGAKGLAYILIDKETGEKKSPILKFFSDQEVDDLMVAAKAEKGDAIFFGADDFITVCESLGAVRSALGDKFNLKDPNEFAYCWVLDFPLFEKKEDGSLQAAHHPFTMPHSEDLNLLGSKDEKDLLKIRSYAYDVVLNGVELGGGSIRIHDQDLQHKMFEALGMNEEEIQIKFGHMLKAFQYGCPPHGGCAMGYDRVVMLFADEPNIREVIAFPKNQSGQDVMLGTPSPMPEAQVEEQNIQVLPKED